MKRWKKGCLVAVIVVLVALFVGVHSRFGKMIAGFVLVPRIEAALEENLDVTVAVGGIDYRLWVAELTLIGIEVESGDRSWRLSLLEARLRFTPLGNVRVVAKAPKVTVRRDDIGVSMLPRSVTRVEVDDGIVRALTSEGFEPRVSGLEAEIERTVGGHRGVVRGVLDDTGQAFERLLVWDTAGIRFD